MIAEVQRDRDYRRIALRLVASCAAVSSGAVGAVYLFGVLFGGIRPSPLWDLFLGLVVVGVSGAVGAIVGLASALLAGLAELISLALRLTTWPRRLVTCIGAGCGAALGAVGLVTPLSGGDPFWTPAFIGALAGAMTAFLLWREQKRRSGTSASSSVQARTRALDE